MAQPSLVNAIYRLRQPHRVTPNSKSDNALGREKALTATYEYARVSDKYDFRPQGLFLIFRALFEVPAAQRSFPHLALGAPLGVDKPQDFPRFPLIITNDIPFFLVQTYALGGAQETVQNDAPYFAEYCRLRAKPLIPPDHPLQSLENLLDGVPAGRRDAEEHRMLVEQFLRLVDTVYRPFGKEGPDRINNADNFQAQLTKIRTDLRQLDLRWDVKTSRYVFAKDGSTLP